MSNLYLDTIVNEGNINARQKEREYAVKCNESWYCTGQTNNVKFFGQNNDSIGFLWKNQVTNEEVYQETDEYFSFIDDVDYKIIPDELTAITIEDVELEYDVLIGIQECTPDNDVVNNVTKKLVCIKELKKNQTVEIKGVFKKIKSIRSVKNSLYRKVVFIDDTFIIKNNYKSILTITT